MSEERIDIRKTGVTLEECLKKFPDLAGLATMIPDAVKQLKKIEDYHRTFADQPLTAETAENMIDLHILAERFVVGIKHLLEWAEYHKDNLEATFKANGIEKVSDDPNHESH